MNLYCTIGQGSGREQNVQSINLAKPAGNSAVAVSSVVAPAFPWGWHFKKLTSFRGWAVRLDYINFYVLPVWKKRIDSIQQVGTLLAGCCSELLRCCDGPALSEKKNLWLNNTQGLRWQRQTLKSWSTESQFWISEFNLALQCIRSTKSIFLSPVSPIYTASFHGTPFRQPTDIFHGEIPLSLVFSVRCTVLFTTQSPNITLDYRFIPGLRGFLCSSLS